MGEYIGNEKFMFSLGEDTIGIRWASNGKITIGGYSRILATIETVVEAFFPEDPIGEPTFVQANKVRFVLQCNRQEFREGLDRLNELGGHLQSTTKLGRVW